MSIDSADNLIENKLGRCLIHNKDEGPHHVDVVKNAARLIEDVQILLKINTTITPLNYQEDLGDLINILQQFRWKVLDVLHIHGVNDNFFREFGLMRREYFTKFCSKHMNFNPICESNNLLLNSYTMISPDGRFYQNTKNSYSFSSYILEFISCYFSKKQLVFDKKKN